MIKVERLGHIAVLPQDLGVKVKIVNAKDAFFNALGVMEDMRRRRNHHEDFPQDAFG
ncbi:MAG: hypothetical protein ACE5KV_02100 [Thermoplasmata archaeon]